MSRCNRRKRWFSRKKTAVVSVLFLSILLCLESSTGLNPVRSGRITADAEINHNLFMDNLLILGDSMIYNPENGTKVFSKHGHQVFAAMGATLPQFFGLTEETVRIGMKGHYIEGTVAGRKYNGIVILMGANDLAGQNEETVFENYLELLRELRSVSSVPVYILQIFPVNRHYSKHYGNYEEKNRRAAALNEMLWLYCESVDGLYFVDATNGFLGDDGQLLHDYGDGLHMDPVYYGMFYENIMVAMSTLKDRIQGSLYDPGRHSEKYWICRLFLDSGQKSYKFSNRPD